MKNNNAVLTSTQSPDRYIKLSLSLDSQVTYCVHFQTIELNEIL